MDESTKQKQAFLRKEIIESGFEPSLFVEFMASQKENGEEIDVWSMESLEEMVERFRADIHQSNNTDSDSYEVVHQPTATVESKNESAGQLSAKVQSQVSARKIKDDSDEDDERTMEKNMPISPAKNSGAKEENQLAEDFIRRSVVDAKEAQAATRSTGNLSENEKHRKELLDKALNEKKSTIVTHNVTSGLRCDH